MNIYPLPNAFYSSLLIRFMPKGASTSRRKQQLTRCKHVLNKVFRVGRCGLFYRYGAVRRHQIIVFWRKPKAIQTICSEYLAVLVDEMSKGLLAESQIFWEYVMVLLVRPVASD